MKFKGVHLSVCLAGLFASLFLLSVIFDVNVGIGKAVIERCGGFGGCGPRRGPHMCLGVEREESLRPSGCFDCATDTKYCYGLLVQMSGAGRH